MHKQELTERAEAARTSRKLGVESRRGHDLRLGGVLAHPRRAATAAVRRSVRCSECLALMHPEDGAAAAELWSSMRAPSTEPRPYVIESDYRLPRADGSIAIARGQSFGTFADGRLDDPRVRNPARHHRCQARRGGSGAASRRADARRQDDLPRHPRLRNGARDQQSQSLDHAQRAAGARRVARRRGAGRRARGARPRPAHRPDAVERSARRSGVACSTTSSTRPSASAASSPSCAASRSITIPASAATSRSTTS